jgi:hypothetical protein
MAIRRLNPNQIPSAGSVTLPTFTRHDEVLTAEDIGEVAGKVIQAGTQGSRTPTILLKMLNGLEVGSTISAIIENQIGNGWVIKVNDYQQEAQENDTLTFLIIWQ